AEPGSPLSGSRWSVCGVPWLGTTITAFSRASSPQQGCSDNGGARLFSAALWRGLCSAKQNSRALPPGPSVPAGCQSNPPVGGVHATKAAMVAPQAAREHPMTFDNNEPEAPVSSTGHVLSELQLFGYHPFDDEPDPRPLPEGDRVAGAISDIFDAL